MDGRGIGVELKMEFGDGVVAGLAYDRRDSWIWETVHDLLDGGSHVGLFAGVFAFVKILTLKVVRTVRHVNNLVRHAT